MDALRLLSRSTGLKLNGRSRAQQQQHPTPSWRGNGNSSQQVEQTLLNRKRKRGAEGVASCEKNGLVDSEFNLATLPVITGTSQSIPTEAERRAILKRHKIKVIDLRVLNDPNATSSKKARKEAARIYPQPLTSFAELRSRYGISHALEENVLAMGFVEPTEVQLAAMSLLLGADLETEREPDMDVNLDLLTIAPTGSGKTMAFLVPLVQRIWRARRAKEANGSEKQRHIRAIVVAPTRELIGQIVNEGRKLTARTGVGISEMRKGMRLVGEDEMSTNLHQDTEGFQVEDDGDDSGSREEEQASRRMATLVKSDILVTTPLLLVNAISIQPPSNPDTPPPTHPLPHIKSLVFDEADVLLDPLFRAQTLAIWSACTSPQLQTSLWSATIGSNIESLALDTINTRQTNLKLPPKPLLRVVVGLKDSALPATITHKLTYAATEPGKLLGLRNLIRPPPSLTPLKTNKTKSSSSDALPPLHPPFLIFTQTIARAIALHTELQYDIPASPTGTSRIAVLHSNLSPSARSATMSSFLSGSIWILITTDLLARGVDFRGVNVVVNYDMPSTAAAYVHRAGRTGRAGREGGMCVTFYTKEDVPYVRGIANVIAASQKADTNSSSVSSVKSKPTVSVHGIPPWLLSSLPTVSRKDKADLKAHGGVDVRRAVREGDEKEDKRRKMKARIGTVSGFDRRKEERRKGAIEASKRRKAKAKAEQAMREENGNGGEEWGGLGD